MAKLLTLKQAANVAAVSFPTIRRWIDSGKIPVIRIGHVLRIDEAQLEAFLNAHTVAAKERF